MKKCGLQGQHEPTYRDNGKWKHARVTCDCAEERLLKFEVLLKAAKQLEKHLMGDCNCKSPIGNCFRAMRDILVNNDLLENLE